MDLLPHICLPSVTESTHSVNYLPNLCSLTLLTQDEHSILSDTGTYTAILISNLVLQVFSTEFKQEFPCHTYYHTLLAPAPPSPTPVTNAASSRHTTNTVLTPHLQQRFVHQFNHNTVIAVYMFKLSLI